MSFCAESRALGQSEYELLKRLREAMPSLVVFSKVNLPEVFALHSGAVSGLLAFEEFCNEFVDFLLCRRDDNRVVVAIDMLEGPRPKTFSVEKAALKKQTFEKAGLPFLVCSQAILADVAAIRTTLLPIVDRSARAGGYGWMLS